MPIKISNREISDTPYAINPEYKSIKFTGELSDDYINKMYKDGWEVMQIMPIIKNIGCLGAWNCKITDVA